MRAWAELTPAQRQVAREQFKTLKKLPPEQRQDVVQKWQEYQQLPPETRRELGAVPAAPSAGAKPAPAPQHLR